MHNMQSLVTIGQATSEIRRRKKKDVNDSGEMQNGRRTELAGGHKYRMHDKRFERIKINPWKNAYSSSSSSSSSHLFVQQSRSTSRMTTIMQVKS